MPDDFKRGRDTTGKLSGWSGPESGKDSKYDEIAAAKEREAFDSEMGWGGLGGASKKPTGSEYKKRLEEWRAKKSKATPKPPPPKPKPAPTPAAVASLSSSEAADALERRRP
jgi:hypothetical protein